MLCIHIVVPKCCQFRFFVHEKPKKKATVRWLFLFPNSLFYQWFLIWCQGGTSELMQSTEYIKFIFTYCFYAPINAPKISRFLCFISY
ncbi:hypothetical protein Xind_01880 [Xenorhabdus indica]|nr:hypothetical protein [Xenorhabdus indica]